MQINIYHSFSTFIHAQEDYDEVQKYEIMNLFNQLKVKKTFMLSLFLLIWSLIGIVLDAVFVGGGVITIFMAAHFMLAAFLPAIVYFVANTLAKFVFIKLYMKKDVSMAIAAIATLPYIGSAVLFGTLLKRHPLFLQALKRYMKHIRKKGLIAVCRLCFQDHTDEDQAMNKTSHPK